MPTPIRLEVVISTATASNAIHELSSAIGDSIASGAQRGVAALDQVEATLKRISAVAGGGLFGGDFVRAASTIESANVQAVKLLATLREINRIDPSVGRSIASSGGGRGGAGTIAPGGGGGGLLPPGGNAGAGAGGGGAQQVGRVTAAVQTLRQGVNGVGQAWRFVGDNALRVLGIVHDLELASSALRGIFVDMLELVENARRFREAISGQVGGLGNAKIVDEKLASAIRDLPISLAEARQIGVDTSRLSALSPQLALARPEAGAQIIADNASTISRLGVLNPEAKTADVSRAVEETLVGRTRSLQLLLKIDPNDLAAAVGAKATDLRNNPTLTLQALKQYAIDRVPDAALRDRAAALPSIQFEKLTDQFRRFAQEVADRPELFDRITDRFKTTMQLLSDYIDTPQFRARAEAIGVSIGDLYDNLFKAGGRLIQNLSGAKDVADTPDAVASQIQSIVGHLAEFSKVLPSTAGGIGSALHDITSSVDLFLTKIEDSARRVSQFADKPIGTTAGAVGKELSGYWGDALDEIAYLSGYREVDIKRWRAQTDGTGGPAPAPSAAGASAFPADSAAARQPYRLSRDEQIQFDRFDSGNISDQFSSGRAFYTAKFAAVQKNIASLDNLLPDSSDKLVKDLTGVHEALASILVSFKIDPSSKTEKPGDFFVKVKEFQADEIQTRQAYIDHLRRDLEPGLSQSQVKDIESQYVASLNRSIKILGEGLEAATEAAKRNLLSASQKATALIASGLKSEDPGTQADFYARILAGQTDVQRQVAATTGQSTSGLHGVAPDEQTKFIANYAAAGQKDLPGLLAKYQGIGGQPLDLAALQRLVSQASSLPKTSTLFGGVGSQNLQLQFLQQQAMPLASQQYDSALATYRSNPQSDEARLGFDRAAASVTTLTEEIRKLSQETNVALADFIKFGDQAGATIEHGLGEVLAGVLEKSRNIREIWSSIGKNIVGQFSQSVVSSVFGSLLPTGQGGSGGIGSLIAGALGGGSQQQQKPGSQSGSAGAISGLAGGVGGLLGLLGGGSKSGNSGGGEASDGSDTPATANSSSGSGGGGSAVGGAGGLIGSIVGLFGHLFAADGAVWSGGYTPFAAFAAGGVVGRPTLGLVGERPGVREAIIPMTQTGHVPLSTSGGGISAMLPGGRSIPAAFFADGGIAVGGFSPSSSSMITAGSASMGGGSRGDAQAGQVVIYNVANHEEAVQRGYSQMKNHILNDVLRASRPGGEVRKALGRV